MAGPQQMLMRETIAQRTEQMTVGNTAKGLFNELLNAQHRLAQAKVEQTRERAGR